MPVIIKLTFFLPPDKSADKAKRDDLKNDISIGHTKEQGEQD